MLVYHFDDNKKYLGHSEAYESPLEPGVFFIPANATDTAPPECPKGYDLFFIDNTWKLKSSSSDKSDLQSYEDISLEEFQQNLINLATSSFIKFCKENTDNYYIKCLAENTEVPEHIVQARQEKKRVYEEYCLAVTQSNTLEELKQINFLEL